MPPLARHLETNRVWPSAKSTVCQRENQRGGVHLFFIFENQRGGVHLFLILLCIFRVVLLDPRPAAGAEGVGEVEFSGGFGDPVGGAEGLAAGDGGAEGLFFGGILRAVDDLEPVGWAVDGEG